MSEPPTDPEPRDSARDTRWATCLGVGMMLGTSVGIVFGLLVFDNLALGIGPGIGMGIGLGVAVAIALDERSGDGGPT